MARNTKALLIIVNTIQIHTRYINCHWDHRFAIGIRNLFVTLLYFIENLIRSFGLLQFLYIG